MVVFDSNILIYFIENDVEFGDKSSTLLNQAITTGGAGFSVLALTELLAHEQSAATLQKLQKLEQVASFIEIDKQIAERAGELRAKHKVPVPDAIHLATAIEAKAKMLVTNDTGLAKIAKKLLPTKTL